jgi:hypothetical protein
VADLVQWITDFLADEMGDWSQEDNFKRIARTILTRAAATLSRASLEMTDEGKASE